MKIPRIISCIYHDKVDLGIWLLTILAFVLQFYDPEWSRFSFILIPFVYYMMYRKTTLWEQRKKFYTWIEKLNVDPRIILDDD